MGGATIVATLGREEGRDGWVRATAVCRRGSSSLPRAFALSFPHTCACPLRPDVLVRKEDGIYLKVMQTWLFERVERLSM